MLVNYDTQTHENDLYSVIITSNFSFLLVCNFVAVFHGWFIMSIGIRWHPVFIAMQRTEQRMERPPYRLVNVCKLVVTSASFHSTAHTYQTHT